MYDDFDKIEYNDRLNTSLWNVVADRDGSSPFEVYQRDGLLNIEVNEYKLHVGVNTAKSYKPAEGPIFFEAKMMLDSNATKDGTDSGIGIGTGDGYSKCSIFAGQDTQTISCWSYYFDVEQKSYRVGITSGTWHVLRIEVDPETMTYKYIVDGTQIGAYVPRNSEHLTDLEYTFFVDLNNWGESAQNPVGYVDYFKIGPAE
jgi:hypothetical protein